MNYAVKVDLIEWYEDDVGQYAGNGLPSSLDEVLHVECAECSGEKASDDLGCAVMNKLEAIYKIRPALVCWSIDEGE